MSRALIRECEDGNIEAVKEMIANGADIHMVNDLGETPLHVASSKGHLEIVKVLTASGGLVNEAKNDGDTPLHIASEVGHLEIVKVLIANKANFLYINYDGNTPLDLAETNVIKQLFINHPWYRRRSLVVTRPHSDHETNKEHQLSSLGEIITATPGCASDPSSQDNVLFQIKIKIASFL